MACAFGGASRLAVCAPHCLQPVLENFLRENLPEDAHTRCKDRAYVSHCQPVRSHTIVKHAVLRTASHTTCAADYFVPFLSGLVCPSSPHSSHTHRCL